MTLPEGRKQFERMKSHFRLGADADEHIVLRDWFRAVQHYHVDAVEAGVTSLIRDAKDSFWPAIGALTEKIRARIGAMESTRDKCGTCHGHLWIEAMPWRANGVVYQGVQRCPDCGVPTPPYHTNQHRENLTASEYTAWLGQRTPPVSQEVV